MNASNKIFHLLLVAVCLAAWSGCRPITTATSIPVVKPSPTIKPAQTRSPVAFTQKRTLPSAMTNQVDAGDYFFYPSVLTVTVGATVRWNHVGSTGHDVTAIDRSWGTTLIPLAGYYEYTFTREGTFDYTCVLHYPAMQGTVVVIRE
jgi:plastocyanin